MAKTRLNGVVTSATTAEESLPSSSSSSFEEQQQQHDAFLLSMTFGNGNNNCNCSDDECNTTYANATNTAAINNVPRLIREAVIDHNNARMKRQRTNANYYSRQRQSRELVRRECGFALYRLTLPPVSNNNNSDPIVEYRNNHRILYIHRLDSNSSSNNNRLYSIGEGIIGSAYEESTRKQLNWVRGTSYLLPKCTGIACGWVVQYYDSQQEQDKFGGDYDVNNDDDDNIEDDENNDNFDIGETTKDNNNDNRVTTTTATAADGSVDNGADAVVIMYSLKISSNDLQSMIHALPTDTVLGGTSPSTWVVKARELFLGRLSSLKAVEEKKMNKYDDDDGDDVDVAVDESSLKDCIALSENESASMKLIIELAT